MNRILLVVPVLAVLLGINSAHAEPLEVSTLILKSDDSSADIELSWSLDTRASKYEVGCVSCGTGITEFSTTDSVIFYNVTPFPNTQNALLYVIAYDYQEEIVNAKQILLDIIN